MKLRLSEIFRGISKKQIRRDNLKAVQTTLARNQESVFKAVKELDRPSSGRMVSAHLKWDSASVTNRLAELTKKGRLKVAFVQRGLDGKYRQYYVVNER
jgi:predicted HTH transcriptional regulator